MIDTRQDRRAASVPAKELKLYTRYEIVYGGSLPAKQYVDAEDYNTLLAKVAGLQSVIDTTNSAAEVAAGERDVLRGVVQELGQSLRLRDVAKSQRDAGVSRVHAANKELTATNMVLRERLSEFYRHFRSTCPPEFRDGIEEMINTP